MNTSTQERTIEELLLNGDALAQNGNIADAQKHFAEAVAREPENAAALTKLGNILVIAGQQQGNRTILQEALQRLKDALALSPENFVALMNAGKASKMLGEKEQAIHFFERAIALRADNPQPHIWLGTIYTEEKRYTHAATHLKKAIEIDPNIAEPHMTLGLVYLAQSRVWASLDRLNQAIHEFEEVLRINPKRTDALMELGMAYHYCERQPDAAECYRRLVELVPQDPKARYHYGTLLTRIGETAKALEHFSEAVRLKPDYIEAYVSKAMVEEQLNRMEDAQATIEAAEKQAPDDARLLMPRAKLDSRNKNYDRAIEGFNKALEAKVLTLKEQGFVLNEMAKLYDKQKKFDEAFQLFAQAQHTLSQTFEAKQHDPSIMRQNFTACRKWYSAEKIATWDSFHADDGLTSPIFVMGFPRSGTTLMETILGSHPQLKTTQEHPLLADLTVHLRDTLGKDIVYPDILAKLKDEQILELRQRYMNNATAMLGEELGGKTVVDKLPLNIPHLGLVQRIFPESKVLIMLRDPRDACLSAFMQSFQVNIAMANFYSLESTVKFYDIVMDLWLHFRSILKLDWMELRYEDVLDDLEGNTRKICNFLNIEWNPAMLSYYESAKGKHIRTPSYTGVIEPLYKSSAGRWKYYAKYFEPYQPMLSRYVNTFGYEEITA